MSQDWSIRPAAPSDVPAIMEIKNHAIVSGNTVYDETAGTLEFYHNWLKHKEEEGWPVFVICPADNQGIVAGYASYGPFRNFSSYRYTIENSLYIHEAYRKQGLGKMLLQYLINDAKKAGYHLMVAVIDSENKASCHLHEQLAFTYSGRIDEAGYKFGQWLNIVFYTLKLSN